MTLHATIESFDSVTYKATVNFRGGFGFGENVPCSKAIAAALLVAGAVVAVALPDPADPSDLSQALVYAVFP